MKNQVRDKVLAVFAAIEYTYFGYTEALILAALAHKGTTDKGGVDYIKHPMHVSHSLKIKAKSNETQMVGLLHDVLEDTDITVDDLIDLRVPESVITALKLMDHSDKDIEFIEKQVDDNIRNGMSLKFAKVRAREDEYMRYVSRLSTNVMARDAKIADIEHNGDLSRVTDKDLDQNSEYIGRRSMKYAKARRLLTGGNVGF